MTTSRRLATLPLLLIGLAALCASLALIPWIVQAQGQEVTPTAAATGANPPAKPTSLQASAVHDAVTLTWTASTDQTVTHYAILRRNPDTDASQVFHVIESNGGPETSYTDGTVSASTTYIYRAKAVSPTGVSQWSGYVKAETPAAPPPISTPTPTPTSTPTPEPVYTPTPEDLRPTGLTVSLVGNKVTLSWTAPGEDAGSVDGYEILRRRPMEGESTLATLVADTESTATTYTDATANEAGVRYVYRVKALRGDDVSLWSNFDKIDLPSDYVPDPTPTPEPESTSDDQAPTGLSAAPVAGGGVALTWTAPSDDADSVTGYEVLRAVGGGEFTTLAADTASTTTSYTDATATEAGETYAYQVKAIRGEDRSQASGQAQVQLPHDPVDLAPIGLTAVVLTASLVVVGEDPPTTASTSVSLSWTAPPEDADSVTGYEILRAVGEGDMATLVDDTGSTATSYTDATATEAGETYAYKVKAVRGEDRSQASGQTRVQLPHDAVDLAPSDLTAEAVDGGGVDLSWSAPTEDADSVTGYEILRAVGEGEMSTLVSDTATTTTTYTDATATEEGETYAYRVKAIRSEARSQGSNRVSLVPVEPPATPENLAPSNLTFEIQEDGVTLAWDAPAAAAGSVTGYKVLRRRPNQDENKLLVWKWDTGNIETTYKDGYAQTHGEYYVYRVRALRGDDLSKMSNWVDVRRPQAAPQTTEWAASNLVALMSRSATADEHGNIQVGDDTVQLSWDAPAKGFEWVRGYEVHRATCDGDFATLVADTGSTETAYDNATFEEGETYTYRVRARRPQGLSPWSNSRTILVPGGTGESECAVPTALQSQVQTPQTGRLTPATLENTLLGYGEEEGAGTLEPNEVTFDEDATFRVTVVSAWPGFPGLVLMLTASSSGQDAALADRDFILEADETVLVVGATEFSFDDALVTHSDTTGGNGEYTGVVVVTWTEGESGLVAGETVDFRLERRDRPDEAQFSQHDTGVFTVKNTGQTTSITPSNLNRSFPRLAQQFTTGANADGYTLASIGFDFAAIDDTSAAGSQLTVTLNADSSGEPGAELCTLTDPASFTADAVNTFEAPGTCPTLAASTPYFAFIERTSFTGTVRANRTISSAEDTGGAAGWSIGDDSHYFSSGTWKLSSPSQMIEVIAPVVDSVRVLVKNTGQTTATATFTVSAAGTYYLRYALVGTTDWTNAPDATATATDDSVTFSLTGLLANASYNVQASPDASFTAAGTRSSTYVHRPDQKDFTLSADNGSARGIWSDGTTMWVADDIDGKLYAYTLSAGTPDAANTFDLDKANNDHPGGLYGSSSTLWVSNTVSDKVYAYTITSGSSFGTRDTSKEFNLDTKDSITALIMPMGMWSDGSTMWLVGNVREEIYAYNVSSTGTFGARETAKECSLFSEYSRPNGMWSDGSTVWVADSEEDRIFAYALTSSGCGARQPLREIRLANENSDPWGIWSDGETLWVADEDNDKVYAYILSPAPSGDITGVSLDRITRTEVDITVTFANPEAAQRSVKLIYGATTGGTLATSTASTSDTSLEFNLTELTENTEYALRVQVDSGGVVPTGGLKTQSVSDVFQDYLKNSIVGKREAARPWLRETYNAMRRHYVPVTAWGLVDALGHSGLVRSSCILPTSSELLQCFIREFFIDVQYTRHLGTLIHELAHVHTRGSGYADEPAEHLGMGWLFFRDLAEGGTDCDVSELYADGISYVHEPASQYYFDQCSNTGNMPSADTQAAVESVLSGQTPEWFKDEYESDDLPYDTSTDLKYDRTYDLERVWADLKLSNSFDRASAVYQFRNAFGGYCDPTRAYQSAFESGPTRNPWRAGGCVPHAPSATVSGDGTGNIAVKLREPPYDGGSPVTRYQVEWRAPGQDFDPTRSLEVDPSVGQRQLPGMPHGSVLRLAAYNHNGKGEFSLLEDTATPEVPANVRLTNGNQLVTVSWDQPATLPARYHVQWKIEDDSWEQSSVASLDGAADRYKITGLVNDTTYTVRVIAESLLGTQSISTELTGRPSLLAEVRNLAYTTEIVTATVSRRCLTWQDGTAGPCEDDVPWWQARVRLTWDHPVDASNVVAYRIERKSEVLWARPLIQHIDRDAKEVSIIEAPDTTGTTFVDIGQYGSGIFFTGNPGEDTFGPVIYTYRITTIGQNERLGNTAEVTLEWRPQGPGEPTNMAATVVSAGDGAHDVTISWDPPDDGSTVTGYRVYRYSRKQFTEDGWPRYGDPIAELGVAQTEYTDAAVPGIIDERINYTYAVRAVKDGHSGQLSERAKLRHGYSPDDGSYYVDIAIDSSGPP